MRDDDLRASENIDDRRGMGGMARGGLGIGAVVVLTLIGWATGIDPRLLIGGAEMVTGQNQPSQSVQGQQGTPTDEVGTFVARVLGETEDVPTQILPQQTGRDYRKPFLVSALALRRPAAARRNRRWVRSIVRRITNSIWTRRSFRICGSAMAAAEVFLTLTSSRTRSDITYRT